MVSWPFYCDKVEGSGWDGVVPSLCLWYKLVNMIILTEFGLILCLWKEALTGLSWSDFLAGGGVHVPPWDKLSPGQATNGFGESCLVLSLSPHPTLRGTEPIIDKVVTGCRCISIPSTTTHHDEDKLNQVPVVRWGIWDCEIWYVCLTDSARLFQNADLVIRSKTKLVMIESSFWGRGSRTRTRSGKKCVCAGLAATFFVLCCYYLFR